MNLAISPHAEADLATIFAASAERGGFEQALRYTDKLLAAFDLIASRDVPWQAIASEVGAVGFRRRSGRHNIYRRAADGTVTIPFAHAE